MSVTPLSLILLVHFFCTVPLAFAETKPAITIPTALKDSHFIELNDWAARNDLHEVTATGAKNFRVLVIGCAERGECFLVNESKGRTRIFEPRLRRDWAAWLKPDVAKEKLRELSCDLYPIARPDGGTGACTLTTIARTRTQLARANADVARVIGSARAPSATINLIRKRR